MDSIPIVVCGFPKSGTTWVARLIGSLLSCPVKGYLGFEGKALATEGLDRSSKYTCYKSHGGLEEIRSHYPNIQYLVYVVRDPRDVIVSAAYHFEFLPKMAIPIRNKLKRITIVNEWFKKLVRSRVSHSKRIEFAKNMILEGSPDYPGCKFSWIDHVYQFQKPEILVLQYENLLANQKNECHRIMNFIGEHLDEDHISKAIASESFEIKKQQFKQANETKKYAHLRSGKSGTWKAELSPSILKELRGQIGPKMASYGYV